MSKAAQAYFATQIATTTQGQLLLLLYDGAIKFLKQARVKIEERNYAQKGILISKAIDIINELNQSLNKEKGGRIADNLNSLYMFCALQLAKANLRMSVKMVDEVINILSSLRQAYAEIVPTHEGDARQPAPVAGVTTPRSAAPPLSHFPTANRMVPPLPLQPRAAVPKPAPKIEPTTDQLADEAEAVEIAETEAETASSRPAAPPSAAPRPAMNGLRHRALGAYTHQS